MILKMLYILLTLTLLYSNKFESMPITLTQPDGTEFNAFLSGDEYYQRLHDADNYSLIQSEVDGFYYYATKNNDKVISSSYKVNSINPSILGIDKKIGISKKEYLKIREEYWEDVEMRDAPSIGTINNLNVFIRFADENEFNSPRSYHDAFFNDSDGPSMYHYFKEVSYELLNVNTHHYPQCDLSTNLSYQDQYDRNYYKPYNEITNPEGYQNNNQARIREHTLLKNAIEFIESEVSTDLDIDSNNDGYVDNVTFLVSGSPTNWADLLWPHRWALYSFDVYIHGSRVYDYNLNLDQGGYFTVGTLCHEFFHSLGGPDLYHYYDTGAPVAVGGWDVMDASGEIPQYMGAYMKYKYTDWITSLPVVEYGGIYNINPLTSSENNIYRINSPLSSNEFFVIEYRVKEGIYDINTPGNQEGILIYRINSSYNGNANGPPDEVYLYRQGGTLTSSGSFGAAIFNEFTGRTQFNDMSNPSCFLSDGSAGGVNITVVGDPGETMQFQITNLILVSNFEQLSYDTDSDGIINPGEEIILDLSISNYSNGINASNITGYLTSDDDIQIINPSISFSNFLMPNELSYGSFVINVNNDISLGDVEFNLLVTSEYSENNQVLSYSNNTSFSIDVSLNQAGYPYFTSSQISSSPAVTDINEDGNNEIFFADYTGTIHAIDSNGNPVLDNIFPYETNDAIWGSPAVADLDLDGNKEIVFSSKDKHLYIFNQFGLIGSYDAASWLISTPVIGNIDNDDELEIIIGGFSSSGKKIYAINHDLTSVEGFPLDINEKIYSGISLYDFNNNGKDDIVVGTDSKKIHLIYDDGTTASGFPFEGSDKFRVSPLIVNYNDTIIIIACTKDGHIYGIDANGQLLFDINTGFEINSSPSINIENSQLYIYTGNENGDVYAFSASGIIKNGFPINLNFPIVDSIMFSDLDNDNQNEMIIADNIGNLNIIHTSDLTHYNNSPIENEFGFASSPLILDIDSDGDNEIISGTVNSLFGLDIKETAGLDNSWNIFKGNYKRTGYYQYTYCVLGDLNEDAIFNVIDIVSLVNIIVQEYDESQYNSCSADLNSDGIINVIDIVALVNLILDN